jgi:hypothetical protein
MNNIKTITLFSLDYLNRNVVEPSYIFLRNNVNKNLEIYFVIFSVLTLYYLPFLFISAYTVFFLYLVYRNVMIDFEFEVRVDTNSRSQNKNILIFNNKKDRQTQTIMEKDD